MLMFSQDQESKTVPSTPLPPKENSPAESKPTAEAKASEQKPPSRRPTSLFPFPALETPLEDGFDRITRLAARMFDVPLAAVALADKDILLFQPGEGWPAVAVRLESSPCAAAFLTKQVLVVEDARLDPRFSGRSMGCGVVETGLDLRFYAGAPLILANGTVAGACA